MVYFISDGEFVKIGHTGELDCEYRLRTLQQANARELVVVAILTTAGQSIEMFLHEKFKHLRVRGEWFKLDDGLSAFIDEVKADPDFKVVIPRQQKQKRRVNRAFGNRPIGKPWD